MLISLNMNIWEKNKKKKKIISCLAPMADVTDRTFRQIIAKYSKHNKPNGGPDIFWTEFVSADGLASKEGRKKLLPILKFSKNEKPIIAQVFGSNPENMKTACKIISKLGFDGIDINMGCPDKGIVRQGAGSALIRTPELAREIIRSAKAGAPKLPISVKTRIGYSKVEEYKTWLPELLKENISALTVHLRTKKEMSKVNAHWELANDISKLVKKLDKNVVLIANGDIKNLKEGKTGAKESGFNGIMIGRGVFGNPWLFDEKKNYESITTKEKIKALIEHIKLFEKLLKKQRHFVMMKKHFKAYINGFEGAKELRTELMLVESPKEAIKILMSYKV